MTREGKRVKEEKGERKYETEKRERPRERKREKEGKGERKNGKEKRNMTEKSLPKAKFKSQERKNLNTIPEGLSA